MTKKERCAAAVQALKQEYPDAICSLTYEDPWQRLVSVRLSAQCTDARVNMVTPALFEKYPTPEAMANADVGDVEELIRSTGFFRAKARDLVQEAGQIVNDYDGKVPSSIDELVKLSGVGRKTANLILGDVYRVPGSVVVDTHCIRISNRLGLVDDLKEPEKIERELRKILPPESSSDFCHCIVLHGRAVCDARRPRCELCCVRDLCRYAEKE